MKAKRIRFKSLIVILFLTIWSLNFSQTNGGCVKTVAGHNVTINGVVYMYCDGTGGNWCMIPINCNDQ